MWGGTLKPGSLFRRWHFNPPSPCGEGLQKSLFAPAEKPFQSTLPVWGGTERIDDTGYAIQFQSTLPVWGGTYEASSNYGIGKFQSTLPVWGGT